MASTYLLNLIEKDAADITSLESALQDARERLYPTAAAAFRILLGGGPSITELTSTVLCQVSTDTALRTRLEEAIQMHEATNRDKTALSAQRLDIFGPPLSAAKPEVSQYSPVMLTPQ